MPIDFNDSIEVIAPRNPDAKKDVFASGKSRPFNSVSEFLTRWTIPARYEGMEVPIRRAGTTTRLDLYWFEGGVEDSNLELMQPEIDLSAYYTKTEINQIIADIPEPDLSPYLIKTGDEMTGDLDMTEGAVKNLGNPVDAGDAVNLQFINQLEINLKQYADLLATDVLRYAGNWDASLGTYPTTGTGANGGIRRGDSYYINTAGTIDGVDFEVGDELRAKVANAGQVKANWGTGQVNTQTATDTRLGIARFASIAETIAGLSSSITINPVTLEAKIVDEKKWVDYGMQFTGETEHFIKMERAGRIYGFQLAGATDLKLKKGRDGVYPTGSQTYDFPYQAGDEIYVTFNYADLLYAKAYIKLKCKED